ncbi:unnamed protein product [Peniophora sp. CBMAI 1063]|nr:unnamed protein product [Peniophora sp. CBMAI 1063]
MAAVAHIANGLWANAANGLANIGATAGAAGAAAVLHGSKLRGLHIPTSPVGLLMFFGFIAVSFVVMANTPPVDHGGQRYYRTTGLSVYFKAENTVVAFPLPNDVAQRGFGDGKTQGMKKGDPIVLPASILAVDIQSLAKVMKHARRNDCGSVTLKEWDSILKLTDIDTQFDFDNLGENLRQLAILSVNLLALRGQISTAELWDLGRRHSVARWIACSCEKLARRDEYLTGEEIDKIGGEAASVVMRIQNASRDWLQRQPSIPGHGRQDYPDFWYDARTILVGELEKDKTYYLMPLEFSPCAQDS